MALDTMLLSIFANVATEIRMEVKERRNSRNHFSYQKQSLLTSKAEGNDL
jgi:hypothetical protein